MAKKNPAKLTKAEADDIASLLGEGFHTAFRKGCYHELAPKIWKDIHDLPRREWGSVIDFVMLCVRPTIEDMIAARLEPATKVNAGATALEMGAAESA